MLTAWLNQTVQPGGQLRLTRSQADQETRERILDAAHAVFTRKGTASSRTQEIADEAGVNKALVHYYFGTKAALADAIFERALAHHHAAHLRDPGGPRPHHRGEGPRHRAGADRLPLRAPLLRRLPHLRAARGARAHRPADGPAAARSRSTCCGGSSARRARAGKIRPISAEQFVVNMMGLLIFPFAIRPALVRCSSLDAARWRAFLEERRRLLPDFFLAGLRP